MYGWMDGWMDGWIEIIISFDVSYMCLLVVGGMFGIFMNIINCQITREKIIIKCIYDIRFYIF